MDFLWSLLSVGFSAMVGIALVDLDTWFSHRDRVNAKANFNWVMAIQRWVAGFLTAIVARLFNVPCRIAGVSAAVIIAAVIDIWNFKQVSQSDATKKFNLTLAIQRWAVAGTAAYSTPILENCD